MDELREFFHSFENRVINEIEAVKTEVNTLKRQKEEIGAKYEQIEGEYQQLRNEREQMIHWKHRADEKLKDYEVLQADYNDLLEEYQKLKAIVDKHTQDAQIHKKALDNAARQKSLQTRQDNAKHNLQRICDAVERYWTIKIGQQGNSKDCKRVDMQWLQNTVGLTERTIRDTIDRNQIGNYARSKGWAHLWTWAEQGCHFENCVRG